MEAACIPHSFGPPINSGYYSKPFFANGIASKQFIQGKNYVIDTQPTLDRLKNKKTPWPSLCNRTNMAFADAIVNVQCRHSKLFTAQITNKKSRHLHV